MKKLALSLAVLFGVAMVSCGGKDNKECNDSVCDTPVVETVEEGVVAVDSTNDSVVAEGAAVEATEEAPAEEPAKEEKK